MSKRRAVLLIAILCISMFCIKESAFSQDKTFIGCGTKETPYLIQSADDVMRLSQIVNDGEHFKGCWFKQTNNIDLSGIKFIPIGELGTENYFDGIYDGDGHYIENLTIEGENNNGFFGQLGGTIMNFGIESGNISGICVGGISSHSANPKALIINCYSKAVLSGARTGGIADNFNGTILNCYSKAILQGDIQGTIVSYGAMCMENCIDEETMSREAVSLLNDTVFSSATIGGVAYHDLNLWNLDNEGNVKLSNRKTAVNGQNFILYLKASWLYIIPCTISLACIIIFRATIRDRKRSTSLSRTSNNACDAR